MELCNEITKMFVANDGKLRITKSGDGKYYLQLSTHPHIDFRVIQFQLTELEYEAIVRGALDLIDEQIKTSTRVKSK